MLIPIISSVIHGSSLLELANTDVILGTTKTIITDTIAIETVTRVTGYMSALDTVFLFSALVLNSSDNLIKILFYSLDADQKENDVQAVWSVVEDYSNYWVGMRSEVMNMEMRREKSLPSSSSPASSYSPTMSSAKILKPLNTIHPIYQGRK